MTVQRLSGPFFEQAMGGGFPEAACRKSIIAGRCAAKAVVLDVVPDRQGHS
jgi:hypothetical protein